MKKITRFLTLAVMAAGAIGASAANYHSLKISLSDETDTYVNFADDFKVSFTDSDMHIVSDGIVVDVPREKIVNMVFSEDVYDPNSGVKETEITPQVIGGVMIFESLPPGSSIRVVDSNGRLVFNKEADGTFSLALSELGSGIFIVTVNSQSYKLNLK